MISSPLAQGTTSAADAVLPDRDIDARLRFIARAATAALHDELSLAPKPGLVSFVDSGSHSDMNAQTMMRSLFALRGYFVRMARLGWQFADFGDLEAAGLQAEARMLAATGGINTHRGAIFTLGLLCAAAGAATDRSDHPLTPAEIRDALVGCWGDALLARSNRHTGLPGSAAARRHGLRSASQEAARAFPTLFEHVWPALAERSGSNRSPGDAREDAARIDALFVAMSMLDDTNIAHRGGIEALRHVQAAARAFLERGGASATDGLQVAWAMHREFVARRLSPGGAADTLAAACWLARVCAARHMPGSLEGVPAHHGQSRVVGGVADDGVGLADPEFGSGSDPERGLRPGQRP